MTGPIPDDLIDRRRLVGRHDIRLAVADLRAPLQVGNGSLAIAVDPTGLQTFPESYTVHPTGTLLGTQSTWGWHSAPGDHRVTETLRAYDTPHGTARYVDLASDIHDTADQTPAESWLRENPHRLDLGRIGLLTSGPAAISDLSDIDQHLDLWSGILTSRFSLAGSRHEVRTAVHPDRDAVAIRVIADAATGLRLRFPYGSGAWGDAADWTAVAAHTTVWSSDATGVTVDRTLDATTYSVRLHLTAPDQLDIRTAGPHEIHLVARGSFSVVVELIPGAAENSAAALPFLSVDEVLSASADGWAGFWTSGAAVELHDSSHPSASELERRIVLSQYVTRVNTAGPMPPAETGLMLNSWRGKFHLEMHWFHGAHYALWGRPGYLDRQLEWYRGVAEVAAETAERQGLPGVRWPKQVDPSGRETPSSIGPFLVWQQPQPIYLAELLWRSDPTDATVARWIDLVVDTATFMAAFASPGENGFDLGPPIVPAQEPYHSTRAVARNPTFELALWQWALRTATTWCERAGKAAPAEWTRVAEGLTPPTRRDGIYMALETAPQLVRDDHPSMLAAYGLVPPTSMIDPAVMSRTFDDVWSDWEWSSTWGWDYPVAAMAATRLGRPDDAVAALLMDVTKNEHLVNGHNYQSAELPIYLPGNGGLLAAVAMMAAGWEGSVPTPGFGDGWVVRSEGLMTWPD